MGASAIGEQLGQEVRSGIIAATGTFRGTPTVVTGVYVNSLAGGGTITLRDGGAGGAIRFQFSHPAVAGGEMIPIPGGIMTFGTDVHATLDAGIDDITIFYR